MSWLTDLVKPRIQSLVRREIPDNLWQKCPSCEQMLFQRELRENLYICKHCDHHLRIPVKERLTHLFDRGEYTRLSLPKVKEDPLHFRDTKRYTDRLKEARSKTSETDAILLVQGVIQGCPVVVACMNFDFVGGSMGMAVGEALICGADVALKDRNPFIVIPSSGGARMQEGILSLMQMPRSVLAVSRLREAGIPYLTVLTHPTTGGVSASFASIGDVTLAEPGATIGFTGARVIQETLRTPLPLGFQSSEFQKDHGMVDMIVPRQQLPQKLGFLCRFLTKSGEASRPQKQRSIGR